MTEAAKSGRSPWAWIPSLYFAEGLPYIVVASVSTLMYKDLGFSNAAITAWTSWLYLPWVIKPLWSPIVDLVGTRRRWVWVMQVLFGGGLAGVALCMPLPHSFQLTLAFFWLLAFQSATHDIAADGFYILGTTEAQQSAFVGIRSFCYRAATMAGQGGVVLLAGTLSERTGDPRLAWSIAMAGTGILLALFGLWHRFAMPRPDADVPGDARRAPEFLREFFATFGSFFAKPRIGVLLAFLLLYRLGEAQLVKMATLFLRDSRAAGGLGMDTAQVGVVYGMFGVAALVAGGLLGGWVVSRHGLKAWLWPMLFAIHLPDAAFLYLAWKQPVNHLVVQLCVMVEQFGYGFGFTAYLLYMIRIARGEHQTAHYAICTGFMAMGMMFPGMWSGWLQQHIGYVRFFTWVMIATVPSFLVALALPLEPEFGRAKR